MNKISKIETILEEVKTPCYVCEEALLRENLKLLKYVADESGAKVLLALKGFAFSGLSGLVSEYLSGCTCSGLHEATFAKEFSKEKCIPTHLLLKRMKLMRLSLLVSILFLTLLHN